MDNHKLPISKINQLFKNKELKPSELYTEVFDLADEMDTEIQKLATTLSQSNPEAMQELKKVMWEGSENWDTLLMERAERSGKLVLSEFTRNAIENFKSK